jgi:hypothetical protein
MSEPFDSYKKFRNKISDLDFEDSFAAAWAFSQFSQAKNFRFPDDVERHHSFTSDGMRQPYSWQLETIVREVVLHASPTNRRGKTLKVWNDVAAVVNALRSLEDVIHEATLNNDNILLEMLRVAHQQFPWQVGVSTRLVGRYFRIFNVPEICSICQKLTGLSVVKIYAIGSGLWGLYFSKAFVKLPMEAAAKGMTDEDLSAFFRLFSKELYALRQEMRDQHVVDDTYPYDNRAIRAHPLIRFRHGGEDYVACPLPTLLFWRFTSGLYYDLTADDDFFNAFGASFQKYVGDVLRCTMKDAEIKVLAEEKYGKKGKTKDTIDWLILDSDAAVFVECKVKRLSHDAKTNLVSRDALLKDIGILADAVTQTYKTISEYRNGKYPSLPYDKSLLVFPMIVTLENWYPLGQLFSDELERAIVARCKDSGISADLIKEMPYTIASVEEFEAAAQIIAKVGCKKFFSEKGDKKYEGWMLEGYMNDAFKAEKNASVDLFADTYDVILAPFR